VIRFLLRLAVNLAVTVFAFWVAVQLLSGMSFTGNLGNWVVVGIIFGLVNGVIRPIVKLLTLPINLVTLGLFTLVVNALMLWLTSWLSAALTVDGFITAFLGAIIIGLVSTVLNWILPDGDRD
jgi:putative membrane protein